MAPPKNRWSRQNDTNNRKNTFSMQEFLPDKRKVNTFQCKIKLHFFQWLGLNSTAPPEGTTAGGWRRQRTVSPATDADVPAPQGAPLSLVFQHFQGDFVVNRCCESKKRENAWLCGAVDRWPEAFIRVSLVLICRSLRLTRMLHLKAVGSALKSSTNGSASRGGH